MRTLIVLLSAVVIGCLPRPLPLAPSPERTAQARREAVRAPAEAGDGPGTFGQAPMGAPPAQPYPPPAQPYPAPAQPYAPPAQQPYPAPAQPYPAPAQPYAPPAQPPYPPNGSPSAPPPGYPSTQMYPPVQPYATPHAYPPLIGVGASIRRSGRSEVIADFAAVGTLAAIDLAVRQDITNGSAATFVVLAGMAGGGATGWLLTERYDLAPGTGHATTLGLLVGAANGALLIEPTGWSDPDQVLSLLLLGSAAGATAGFAYGQTTELTSGQSTFVGNAALLGSATAAFTAIAGSRDGEFGGWEDSALALGLDAGVLGGALIAPHLDWSPRRSKIVFASTAVGALLGGALVGLITKRRDGNSSNGDLIAGCMTAGMWGGFGLGALLTSDAEPDGQFQRRALERTVQVAPFTGDRGEVGIMAGGSW